MKAHDVFPAVCYPDYFWQQARDNIEGDWYLMCPHEILTCERLRAGGLPTARNGRASTGVRGRRAHQEARDPHQGRHPASSSRAPWKRHAVHLQPRRGEPGEPEQAPRHDLLQQPVYRDRAEHGRHRAARAAHRGRGRRAGGGHRDEAGRVRGVQPGQPVAGSYRPWAIRTSLRTSPKARYARWTSHRPQLLPVPYARSTIGSTVHWLGVAATTIAGEKRHRWRAKEHWPSPSACSADVHYAAVRAAAPSPGEGRTAFSRSGGRRASTSATALTAGAGPSSRRRAEHACATATCCRGATTPQLIAGPLRARPGDNPTF